MHVYSCNASMYFCVNIQMYRFLSSLKCFSSEYNRIPLRPTHDISNQRVWLRAIVLYCIVFANKHRYLCVYIHMYACKYRHDMHILFRATFHVMCSYSHILYYFLTNTHAFTYTFASSFLLIQQHYSWLLCVLLAAC